MNAALHHAGVTRSDDVFPMQPGVYLVPQADGALEPAVRCRSGDVLHVGRPKIEATVPADLTAMMHAMETIERHRDPCVREGDARRRRRSSPNAMPPCGIACRLLRDRPSEKA